MKKFILISLLVITVAFVITAAVLLFTGPHMDHQPSLKAYESELNLPPEDAEPFFNPENRKLMLATPAMNVSNLEKGRVYYGYYCIFCHGDDGKGNGPVGQSFVPKPADLTDSRILRYDSLQLYNAAFKGVHAPVLERVVAPANRRYILLYIREKFATRH